MATISPQDDHIEIDVTEARQGLRGTHALVILAISTALTVVVFLAAYWVNSRNLASVNTAPMADRAAVQNTNGPTSPVQ